MSQRGWRLGAALALVVTASGAVYGCGAAEPTRPRAPSTQVGSRGGADGHSKKRSHGEQCNPAGRLVSGQLTLCQRPLTAETPGRFEVGPPGARHHLRVKHPFGRTSGHLHGLWAWAAASPDGKTILAQFYSECEVPTAFFVAAAGGTPRAVTGPYTHDDPPEDSVALGWTSDGRAIVFFPAEPGCGGTRKSGVYLISLSGDTEKVAPTKPREPPPLKPSLRARTVASVKQALTVARP